MLGVTTRGIKQKYVWVISVLLFFSHTGGVSWAVDCHEWSSWQTPVPRPLPWSPSLRLCSLNWEEAVVSSWSWPPGESNKTDRLQRNPIRGLLLSCKGTVLHVMCALTTGLLWTLSEPHTNHQRKLPFLCSIIQKGSRKKIYNRIKIRETPTFASNWLAKNGGLHMQKSYTISVSSFKASINNVFWGTLTTRIRIKQRFPNYEAFCLFEQAKEFLKGDKS